MSSCIPPSLILTRGLPGSGKTTWALKAAPLLGAVVVDRDKVRATIWPGPGPWPHGDRVWEDRCTVAQHAMVDGLLRHGTSVILHDTNLLRAHLAALRELGEAAGATVSVRSFLGVSIEQCIERDALRPESEQVGAAAIRRMWAEHLADRAADHASDVQSDGAGDQLQGEIK